MAFFVVAKAPSALRLAGCSYSPARGTAYGQVVEKKSAKTC